MVCGLSFGGEDLLVGFLVHNHFSSFVKAGWWYARLMVLSCRVVAVQFRRLWLIQQRDATLGERYHVPHVAHSVWILIRWADQLHDHFAGR